MKSDITFKTIRSIGLLSHWFDGERIGLHKLVGRYFHHHITGFHHDPTMCWVTGGLIVVTESPNFRDGITSAIFMIMPHT